MPKHHVKYNPSFLSEAQLIENFVVRHADLDLIIRIISENHTGSNQHVLVIGPRGSGKTTLVHRVAAEIKQTSDLHDRWYPLIFSEESYEVVSVGEFWLEALFHLSEQTNDEKWKVTYSELKAETEDQRLAERALAQLLDFADSMKKRILLCVENLNMLLGDLASDDAWKIRHTLMNEPRLMLLATATSRFEQIENSSQAMFEMFKQQELKSLDDDECNLIWELIAGEMLSGEKIKPIRILTGGNPRLLTIIAKFGAHRSFRQLLDDLVDLIDDHTEYFKTHLDNLPVTERKVYLALAGLWDASTARDIAKAARLDTNKTSSLLSRLIRRGAVIVEDQRKKVKWYAVSERMYNIYYLMRRRGKPSDRVKATVKFMISMYDPESAAKLITDEACRLSPEACQYHYLAYEETIKEVPNPQIFEKILSSTPKAFLESPYLSETLKNITVDKKTALLEKDSDSESIEFKKAKNPMQQAIKFIEEGTFAKVIKIYDEVIERFADAEEIELREQVAMAMVNKGNRLGQLNCSEEEIAAYDQVIERFADAEEIELREKVAMAMVNKGNRLGQLNRSEEAVVAYDEVIEHFADAEEVEICEQMARALSLKGSMLVACNKHEEAERALRKAIELMPDSSTIIIELISLLLKRPGKLNIALQTANEVIDRKPDDSKLLNGIAWVLYKNENSILLPKAENWSRQAVTMSPENTNAHHTYACILSALGKGNEALPSVRKYIQDSVLVENSIDDTIELFVELAASGNAKEALDILVNSPSHQHLEPLVIGLKKYIGEDVKTAIEIMEVANDVVKRIEERVKRRRHNRESGEIPLNAKRDAVKF